ncbi:MAG: PD-(D/E)XK nuclease family protein [Promethearchaeota archaeon]
MRNISPSLLKEYLFCPRSFYYRKLQHFSLISSTNDHAIAQERIDTFTSGFFSTLKIWNESQPKTHFELEYLLSSKFFTYLEPKEEKQTLRELDEKIFTILLWLTIHLWEKNTSKDYESPNYLPLMVNEFIQAPELHLQGRPSAVFRQQNNSALLFIQTFQQKLPHIKNSEHLQATIYARILQAMGINAQDYLFVNYHSMDLKFQQLKSGDFISLDNYLHNFKLAIREGNFDPPKNPPCLQCEFKWICKD